MKLANCYKRLRGSQYKKGVTGTGRLGLMSKHGAEIIRFPVTDEAACTGRKDSAV